MASAKKIVGLAAVAAVAFVGLIGAKWYHTTTSEAIDPQRGIFGMDGLEIWIDINARMPAFARNWACNTLLAREEPVIGGKRAPHLRPYSCQPGFGSMQDVSAYETIVNANLGQATAGLDAAKAQALRACFDAAMASAVTPEDIAAANDDVASDAAKKVVIAASEQARACKAEMGL